jgi:FKBP-type peptidyl-prolyl cis-trans isomerase 2
MILFKPNMKNEKIAVIGLSIIIITALSFFILSQENPETGKTYFEGIADNLFGRTAEKEILTIEEGDCVDLNYIGRFANGTIFESSYADPEQKTNGEPLKIYVVKDYNLYPPSGFERYYPGIIDGLLDGLIGLEEGQEVTIGPIPPDEAYGYKVESGDSFYTQQIIMDFYDISNYMNITVEVTSITSENISLRWIDIEDFDNFTMPGGIMNNLASLDEEDWFIQVPPYYIWENSTEIVEIKQDVVIIKTTPTKTENITDEILPISYGDIMTFIFPNATTVTYDDETITIDINPKEGTIYTLDYFDMEISIEIQEINITNDTIDVLIFSEYFDEQYMTINKTVSFDREFVINRNFTNIPIYYAELLFGEALEEQLGLSLNPLAGETLYYDVVVETVYKTSDPDFFN